jgi:hypothetical protein
MALRKRREGHVMTAYETRVYLADELRMGYREVAGLISDAVRDGQAGAPGVTLAFTRGRGFTVTRA